MNARTDLTALHAIRAPDDALRAMRQAIHANPGLGFEEVATSGLGKTGMLGTLVRDQIGHRIHEVVQAQAAVCGATASIHDERR